MQWRRFKTVLKDLQPLFSLAEQKWCRGLCADGRQQRHGWSCVPTAASLPRVLGSTPTPHNANVYVLCRESKEASVP